MPRSGFVHRNPVDAINLKYVRDIARIKRDLPLMHYTRCELICQARRKHREALAELGIRPKR